MPPFFDENPLAKLAGNMVSADHELDLRGLDERQALARIDDLLSNAEPRHGATYCLRFDPADGGGSETLFLPVGRRLLEARRAGQLLRCLPLESGDGYLIALAAGDAG